MLHSLLRLAVLHSPTAMTRQHLAVLHSLLRLAVLHNPLLQIRRAVLHNPRAVLHNPRAVLHNPLLKIGVGKLHEVYRKACMPSQMVADGIMEFSALSAKDQSDVENFDCRIGFVRELAYLLTQKLDQARPYPGAGVVVRAPS